MAELPRGSSFLPTIKCSMCAADIEISRMGDHLCAGRGDEPTTAPEPQNSYNSAPMAPLRKSPSNDSGFLKPGRPGRQMPPRVDTSAANRPFQQEPLTPGSSPSIGVSPATPGDRSRSPFARPMRSATAPMLRPAPPSPEILSSNLDCAFPPFPTSKPAKSKPKEKYAEADPMYAPMSPNTVAGGGLLKRMNTISPGPFDVKREGPNQGNSPQKERGHQRQATVGSNKDMFSEQAEMGASIQRPATAGSIRSRRSTHSSSGSKSGFALPKQPRKNGYGGFGAPAAAAAAEEGSERPGLQPEQRSKTFPRTVTPEPSTRRPSEPGQGMRRPSNGSERPFENGRSISGSPPRQRKQSIPGPDRSRPLPPRGASLVKSRNDPRLGNAPPVPTNVNLAAEFGIGNPYHAPSESQSSDASGYSQESKTSSRSSPPSTTTRERSEPDDNTKLDTLMSEVQASMMDLQPKELASSPSPPRKEQEARGMLPPRNLDPSLISPESPMDPAIQSGRFSPLPARNPARAIAPTSPPKDTPPVRRPTTSKGNCKGCSLPIKGKSVSSADGRLTGRYHKQCFVCKTCAEPFATATFYVINDAPYCEAHYHKLNGSVCKTCDKGIEGQYLETAGKQKFHPKCLTCSDCNRSLTSAYFEMNGRVFCERDAFRRAQQGRFLGPGGPGQGTNRMERRTTRLMMMG